MVKFWSLLGIIPLLVGLSAFAADGTAKFNELLMKLHLEGVEKGLKKAAAAVNKKVPFAIDDVTILLRQEAVGLTLTSYLKVKIHRSKVSPQDLAIFKKEVITQRCKLAASHDGYKGGIVTVADYVDINNEPFAKIFIDEKICSKPTEAISGWKITRKEGSLAASAIVEKVGWLMVTCSVVNGARVEIVMAHIQGAIFSKKIQVLVQAKGDLLLNAAGAGGTLIIPNQSGLIERLKNAQSVRVAAMSARGIRSIDVILDGSKKAIDAVMKEFPTTLK